MFRIGQGFDVHQLVPERDLIIGGVNIPFDKGLLGITDADVLLHAIADALLGAINAGDIGQHFPGKDARTQNLASTTLLTEVFEKVIEKGYEINNLDCTILAEQPKMQPYIFDMQQNIAKICQTSPENVSVKATTMETMDAIGNGEGIGAMAVVLLTKKA